MLLFQLEKEALAKGVPIEQAIDIEIPPPRPKRKPNNPYPRKSGYVSSPNTQARAKDSVEVCSGSSHRHTVQVLDLEKEPLSEKSTGDDGKENNKEACGNEKHSEGLQLSQEAPSTSAPPANENSAKTTEAARKSCKFKQFVPVNSQSVDTEKCDSHAADGSNQDCKAYNSDAMETVHNYLEDGTQAIEKFPRPAPVQILDGSLGACSQAISSDVSYQESAFPQMGIPSHPAVFNHPPASAAVESQNSTSRSTNHHMFPTFHPPFAPFPNIQENYSSFLQMSSTFSSLIVSALLQNPAAHAAASFAASFWPCSNMDTTASTPVTNGFEPRPVNQAPSMAAIAAATVAAATAWWAAHGLLPMCSPLHPGFTWPSPSATTPFTNLTQTQPAYEEREENNFQNPNSQVQQADQELSEALQPQHSASKSSATYSSDSGNSKDAKIDVEVAANDNEEKVHTVTEQKESSEGKVQKQVDRSSCGSNTPSGSDAETEALKNDKGNEESKEPDASHPSSEPGCRRNRIANSINDSRKEVSEGGRLAFQALFSRERLPQSFSPPEDLMMEQEMSEGTEGHRQNADETNEDASLLDLNSNTWVSCSSDQCIEKDGLIEDTEKDGPTIGLTEGKLKTRKTGFKPYKRCSTEAREGRVMNNSNQDQEKCSKRLRLEREAST